MGCQKISPGPAKFLDGKQIELLAQHAMVALLRLFQLLQMSIEFFLREKRSPVNPLQLLILLIAQPVRAGNVEQLECLDLPGRRNMRPAAEIRELAGAVDRNLFIGLGELLDEMALHEVAFFFELRQPLVARQKFARVGNILLHQFLHLLLDFFQIFGSKRSRPVKVVEKSALGRRTVAELGLRKKLQHRGSQQMRRRMPVNFQRLRIFLRQQAEIGIRFQRLGEIDQRGAGALARLIAVGRYFGNQRRIRQPRADRLRNIEREWFPWEHPSRFHPEASHECCLP